MIDDEDFRVAETSTVAAIRSAIRDSQLMGSPSRVVGRSGVGKSTALRFLRDRHGEHAGYGEVNATHRNAGGMYRLLIQAFGWHPPANPTMRALRDTALTVIPRSGLMLVDEFQLLEPLALRELFSVQERRRFALVLVGNGHTLVNRRLPEQLAAMEQIERRIGYRDVLGELTDDDFQRIAIEWNVECQRETYAAIAAFGRRESLHQLNLLFVRARRIAGGGQLTLDHLRTALTLMRNDESAVQLLEAPAAGSPTTAKRKVA